MYIVSISIGFLFKCICVEVLVLVFIFKIVLKVKYIMFVEILCLYGLVLFVNIDLLL